VLLANVQAVEVNTHLFYGQKNLNILRLTINKEQKKQERLLLRAKMFHVRIVVKNIIGMLWILTTLEGKKNSQFLDHLLEEEVWKQ